MSITDMLPHKSGFRPGFRPGFSEAGFFIGYPFHPVRYEFPECHFRFAA